MDSSWVKLHRKLIDNDIFRHDRTAWHVFEVLLIISNRNGEWSGGMYQLSELTNEKRSTLYRAIERLEKAKMINRLVNTRYTLYHICKWGEYQGKNSASVNTGETASKQPLNSEETAGNTLTRIRIKNKNNKYVELHSQYQRIHEKACEFFGKNPNQYKLSDTRKKLLKVRLSQLPEETIVSAIEAISQSPFHRGDNDRQWEADPYWVLKSFEKTEEWASKLNPKNNTDLTKVEIEV